MSERKPRTQRASASRHSEALLALAERSMFNPGGWRPVPGTKITLKEFWDSKHPGMYELIDGDTMPVEATLRKDGSKSKRILIYLQDEEDPVELPVGTKSELEDGDEVDVDSIYGQSWRKMGREDIFRFDGEKVVEDAEEVEG